MDIAPRLGSSDNNLSLFLVNMQLTLTPATASTTKSPRKSYEVHEIWGMDHQRLIALQMYCYVCVAERTLDQETKMQVPVLDLSSTANLKSVN